MKAITERLFNLIVAYNPNYPDNLETITTLLRHSEEYKADPLLADLAIDTKEYFEHEGVQHSLFTLACRVGNFRVMRLLEEHELAIGITAAPKVQTALWLAAMNGHYSVAEYLIGGSIELNSPSIRDTETIEHLYGHSITVNYVSFPLTAAAQRLDYKMLVLLLANNADTNVQENLNIDPEVISAATRRAVTELQQQRCVSKETGRKASLNGKAKDEGLTAHELVEFQQNSEQKNQCFKLLEAKNSLDESISAADLEERKEAFNKALRKDTYFVTCYLAEIAKTINTKLNQKTFRPKFDKVEFLRFALKELCRACEDNSKVVNQMHPSLVEELIPAKVGEVDLSQDEDQKQFGMGIFQDADQKMIILNVLGAKSEFGNTFFARQPIAARAPEGVLSVIVGERNPNQTQTSIPPTPLPTPTPTP